MSGFYTQADIAALNTYAHDRGITLVPEFDMPGHAAGLLALQDRGIEFCNVPGISSIPNWCTLKGDNGSVAQKLLPSLVKEMRALFNFSEVYHIGGDEARCQGSGEFKKLIVDTVETEAEGDSAASETHTSATTSAMLWSDAAKAGSARSIVQTWTSPNASTLASQGTFAVESAPFRFYLSSGRSDPTSVTAAWCDLWQHANESSRARGKRFLLGGEIAMWTDQYTYINDCVRPHDGKPGASYLWNRSEDAAFGRSVGSMLWPRGHLAAGSFWHFPRNSSSRYTRPFPTTASASAAVAVAAPKEETVQTTRGQARANAPRLKLQVQERVPSAAAIQHRVLIQHNAFVAGRGGLTCPVGCSCSSTSSCGAPYAPTPPPTPRPPKPPTPPLQPTPAPAPSSLCQWLNNTALDGGVKTEKLASSKEECCGLCRAANNNSKSSSDSNSKCAAAAWHQANGECILRSTFEPKLDKTHTTLACRPTNSSA